MDVENFGARPVCQQLVAHGMHQVGLAQADATVDEKRVVQMPGHARHMHGRSAGHAVGRAFNQGVKSKRRVEPVFGDARRPVFSHVQRFFNGQIFNQSG